MKSHNKKKIYFLSLIFVFLLVIIYIFWPTDERRITKLFKEGAEAIEKEDLDIVMSKISYNYYDEYGLTYLYIKRYLKSFFSKMSNIKIDYENLNIKVNGKNAFAEVDVRVIATLGDETGYLFGDLSNPEHLKFILEKQRTKWLVIKTEGLPIN